MAFAFIFGDVGAGEWFVLLAVILIVVGPKRLPEAARKFGNVYSKFRRAAENFKRQLLDMDTDVGRAVREVQSQVDEAKKAFADASAEVADSFADVTPKTDAPAPEAETASDSQVNAPASSES